MAGILTQGFQSLFANFNKAKPRADGQMQEGVVENLEELTLEMDDAELIRLKKSWEVLYANSQTKNRIHADGDINERYWVGRQFPDTEYENGKRPLTDNIIFEALETMIPLATQQNPEPIVITDSTQEMKDLADKTKMALQHLSNYNNLKTKLKKGVRHWSLRFVGCWQIAYDAKDKEIIAKVVNPKELILDPNGYIEDGVYHGEFLGMKMTDTASNLIVRFPVKKEEIERQCQSKMGSLMSYTQWWTDEYIFYTLKDIILQKSKNPHWNYEQETETIDDYGQPIQKITPGKNHFERPKMPFVFLTVFDLGDEPADKTSLIQQGLTTQDNINKRLKQIDRNADNINGGVIVSGQFFNKEQAGQVAEARRQGRTIVVPVGNISEAIQIPQNQSIPDILVVNLQDQRQRFLARFGASGSTNTGSSQERTVRGKIINQNNDSSRIGGGVAEYLEVAASRIFNYWIQMIYVYYDSPHMISIIGPNNAQIMSTIQASEFPQDRKLFVKVQSGSMVPKDELSEYNEAMSLWEGGALDPLSLFERLKDTNPQERAMKLITYRTNPVQYIQQYLGQQPMAPMMLPAGPGGQPLPQGGGMSTATAPPASVPQPAMAPTPEQQVSNNLIKQVPIPG